ncbi:MAG: GNAT family N-acetyltransferase [Polyangiales bacterium]
MLAAKLPNVQPTSQRMRVRGEPCSLAGMLLRFVDVTDPLYQHALELRYRVLREPLGRPRSEVTFPFEAACIHLVAIDDNQTRGCVMFHPETERSGRLMQMAVDSAIQGRGLGRLLVQTLEAELVRRGWLQVQLHARAPMVGFYERLGYTTYGEPYLEIGLPHQSMHKTLAP